MGRQTNLLHGSRRSLESRNSRYAPMVPLQLIRSFADRAIVLRWASLLLLSALVAATLELIRLPAALLLGPMIAAIVVAVTKGGIRVPHRPVLVAQAIIGAMIARSIPPSILGEILQNWPLLVLVVAAVIMTSSAIGWLLTYWRVLPGSTAIWGSSPGAATAMMLMGAAYGADIRLVAFMQYLRAIMVVGVASIVARLWTGGSATHAAAVVWFPPIDFLQFAGTMVLVVAGAASSRLRRLPAAPLLLPLGAGIILQDIGLLTIELPPWLLATSYALVGWNIGLGFNRSILLHAARALPRVMASIVALIVVCGALAALLVVAAGIDPLTAYLATSPGGADSAAIIAVSSNADVGFVMAMQTSRLLITLLIGPSLAAFIARRTGATRRPNA